MHESQPHLGDDHPLEAKAEVAIIGGSGHYSLFDSADSVELVVDTPFGPPSGTITLGNFGGKRVAFLTRHGASHALAPHEINYRANMWALASLGARAVVSSSAVGSLRPEVPVDSFVVPDQMLDRTVRRISSFSGDGLILHLPFADPFTPALVEAAKTTLHSIGETVPQHATTAVIEGPRFSTRAESRQLAAAGADIVNMTQNPEAALAQELGMGIVNLSFVTDSDAGDDPAEAVDSTVVFDRLQAAQSRLRAALSAIVTGIEPGFVPPRLVPAEVIDAILALPVRQTVTAGGGRG